jgi:phosphoglycolate phosphatase-like HAD superfamily hydrolase
MVGDSHVDGEAGTKAGLPFILVSYGYKLSQKEPLPADKVIDEFKMLPQVITELSVL